MIEQLILKGPRGIPRGRSLLERVDALSIPIPELGCYIWLGGTAGAGYPTIKVGSTIDGTRRTALVHRLVYEIYYGPIPSNFDVAHKCHIKLCVRPEHLQAITHQRNCAERPVQAGAYHRYDMGLPGWRA